MPTIYHILKFSNQSKANEVYDMLHILHELLQVDGGGDLAMDNKDKGIFTLITDGPMPRLICKRS